MVTLVQWWAPLSQLLQGCLREWTHFLRPDRHGLIWPDLSYMGSFTVTQHGRRIQTCDLPDEPSEMGQWTDRKMKPPRNTKQVKTESHEDPWTVISADSEGTNFRQVAMDQDPPWSTSQQMLHGCWLFTPWCGKIVVYKSQSAPEDRVLAIPTDDYHHVGVSINGGTPKSSI